MNARLIGYPNAGSGFNYAGHISEVITPTQHGHGQGHGHGRGPFKQTSADVYGLIAAGLGIGIGARCDITGTQGAGKVKARRARAVGAGVDPDVARAQAFVDWLECKASEQALNALLAMGADVSQAQAELAALKAERARLMASAAFTVGQDGAAVLTEANITARLLAIAGGATWDGRKPVAFNGGGMAARAARYVMRRRGIMPSDTSLQDAAAAALARIWEEWLVLSALMGDTWTDATLGHLCAVAWRAAFHSFNDDGREGKTGRKAGQPSPTNDPASMPLDAAALQVAKASLQQWADTREGRIFATPTDTEAPARAARRRVIQWLAGAMAIKPSNASNGERERAKAARARFSVLVRLIHGRDWASAARAAGFASGRAAAFSFQKSKQWARLRGAVATHSGQRERGLLAIRRRAARRAVKAIKSQRASAAGAGRFDLQTPSRRRVIVPAGAACVQYSPALASQTAAAAAGAVKLVHPAARRVIVTREGLTGAGKVHPAAREWSQAITERGGAVALARAARTALRSIQRERVEQWEQATKGLRAGWLR